MTLLFEIDEEADISGSKEYFKDEAELEEQAHRVIGFVVDHVGCPYEVEVNLTLTDNENIREINRRYREMDKATDVLSFPMVDYENPLDFSIAESSPDEYFNPDTGELLLGDIMISIEKAVEQSIEYGHGFIREYSFLIVHSMLHLFGYDHIEDDDRKVMEDIQKQIMEAMGITR